ncbi:MAG: polysaccharide biosynthesis/export family protein [Candidatus Brocadiales bacterium]
MIGNPMDAEEARFLETLDADAQTKLAQDRKIRLKGFYLQRGKRFFYEGNTERAREELKKVLELDPLSNEAKAYISMIETGQDGLVVNVPTDPEGVIPTLPEYKITINDLLDISVWGYDEFKKEVSVRPDGRISFPLIGDIWALGLTPQELDDLITKELSEYVRDPKVTVVVKQFSKPQVVILGEVRIPGMYDVFGEQRLIEVLARAGGLTEKARSNNIFLVHQTVNGPEILSVSIQDAIKNNTTVDHLDLVYVPTRGVNLAEVLVGVISPLAYSFSTTVTGVDLMRKNIFVAPSSSQ